MNVTPERRKELEAAVAEMQAYFRHMPKPWGDLPSIPSPPHLEPKEWDYEWSEEEIARLKSSGRVDERFFHTPNDIKKEDNSGHLKFLHRLLRTLGQPRTAEEKAYCDLMCACINNRLDVLRRKHFRRIWTFVTFPSLEKM